jgi:hypothetical protein
VKEKKSFGARFTEKWRVRTILSDLFLPPLCRNEGSTTIGCKSANNRKSANEGSSPLLHQSLFMSIICAIILI